MFVEAHRGVRRTPPEGWMSVVHSYVPAHSRRLAPGWGASAKLLVSTIVQPLTELKSDALTLKAAGFGQSPNF